jgi:hypothetical protein
MMMEEEEVLVKVELRMMLNFHEAYSWNLMYEQHRMVIEN